MTDRKWPTPQTVDGKKTARPPRKKKDRQTRNETPGSYRGDLADWVALENSACSQGQEEDSLDQCSLDSGQLPLLRSTPIASECSVLGAAMWPTPRVSADRNSAASITRDGHWSAPALAQAVELASGILPREVETLDDIKSPAAKAMWRGSPSTATSETSTPPSTGAGSTSYPAASRVSRSRKPGSGGERTTRATCGHTPFAYWSSRERRWDSSRMCLAFSAQATSEPFSETWPKRGSMRNGACWEQTTSVPRIDASGSGFWPSATATTRECTPEQWEERRREQGGTLRSTYLQDAVKYQAQARGGATRQTWHTPAASDNRDRGHMGMPAVQRRQEKGKEIMLSMQANPDGMNGSLNPTWVGPLMGWPMNWEDSETPHVREFLRWLVSFRLSHLLYFAHGTTNHRTAEEVRAMRSRDDTPSDAERASGGHGDVPQEEVLLSLLCELKTALDEEADLSLACEEVDRQRVCGVREEDQLAGAPRRWGPVPQPAGEHPDLVHHLSPLSPRYGVEAWLDGSWEAGIPRVATGVAHRVDRLRALGNGQVPQCMAAAFTYLARQAGVVSDD